VQRRVSFDTEELILVDSGDNVIGHDSKANVHRGRGMLHRAFSIFLFDADGRVLLHRRSPLKPLWPGFWTNSCCSHPRRGEPLHHAAQRRLREELGVTATLQALYRFRYSARYADVGSERELCTVFIGVADAGQCIVPNALEVEQWSWFACAEVDDWIRREPGCFTPWFLMEWRRLRGDLRDTVTRLCG